MTARDFDLEAAEYALGTTSAEDRRAIEAECANNPALAKAIAGWEARLGVLAAHIAPVAPPAGLWDKIDATLNATPDPRLTRVPRDQGVWIDLLPGVTIKVLSKGNDDGTETFLLKLAPGARVPAHQHPHTEECFIVEGTMSFGTETFGAGDYVSYPAGVAHTEVFSPTGGTILIRGCYA